MISPSTKHAAAAIPLFAIDGELLRIVPYERGHIHNTFISEWKQDYGIRRYLHQQMNDRVFRDVAGLMHNIEVVTRHIDRRMQHEHAAQAFHTLHLVAPKTGGSFLQHASGPWRTYRFIENTETFDLCRDEKQAFEAARAFGRFQWQLSDLDASTLKETIPDFFSSPHRLRQLESAIEGATDDRKRESNAAIDFVLERRAMIFTFADLMERGELPVRIVHGDTKLNNVLFDRGSGRAVSIVDLDTCMPSYSLYDFGDLVRFTAATSAEDEVDLKRVGMNLKLYRALVLGYLDGTRGFLSKDEVEWMPLAARLVTLTIGMRFLADYLNGDVYFKIDPSRPSHNLDRARVQFEMVKAMERQSDEMRP